MKIKLIIENPSAALLVVLASTHQRKSLTTKEAIKYIEKHNSFNSKKKKMKVKIK